MRKYLLGGAGLVFSTLALTIISWTPSLNGVSTAKTVTEDSLYTQYVSKIYTGAHLQQAGLNPEVFQKALTGFYNLKSSGKISTEKSILTIADFDVNSTKKRLWIIDLKKDSLLLNTWVAHGSNSGADMATRFSDANDSNESSLGFYVTAEIYNGKHGRSLRLDGMDEGYNSNARKRSIVVHGAPYVSQSTIDQLGRLGHSQGCPAVPAELSNLVINTIEGKTVIFINGSDQSYSSKYLDTHLAANSIIPMQDTTSTLIARI
ncbi:murein L,D-transpeptidase catalytic domain family protein [Pedobacter sp. L105]|uniref:murein L,D-transpeptidase catalytic domain family protein n=1 Tax=Pedobacter sp. L105 TaxID=1641871 RepID=UPI00131D0E0E|nr:murein L,D-transpeptidase catalytic domain family protein [Pedobacter sp. L105]